MADWRSDIGPAKMDLEVLWQVVAETPGVVHQQNNSCAVSCSIYIQCLRSFCVANAEKNLEVLRQVVAETPGVTLAFVGEGPERKPLEEHFRGLPVTFMVRRAFSHRQQN